MKITVIDQLGTDRSFSADNFDVDENGYLRLRADDAVIAVFSPAAWHGVLNEEAAG